MSKLTITTRDDGVIVIDGPNLNAELTREPYELLTLLAEVLARNACQSEGYKAADIDAWFESLDRLRQARIVLFEALVDAAEVRLRQRLANPTH